MVCVVCSLATTEGELETPVVFTFASKAEAIEWVKKDVEKERQELNGFEVVKDKGELDENEHEPWWQLDVVISEDGDYVRMTQWDIVEPQQVSENYSTLNI